MGKMKKIAFILKFFQTESFHGGGEKLFYNLIKKLSQDGHIVDIYCSKTSQKTVEGINKIVQINEPYNHLNPCILEQFYEKAKALIKKENYDYVVSENITPPVDITFLQGHSMVYRQKSVKTPFEAVFYPFRKIKRERIKYQEKWLKQGYRKIFVPSQKVKTDLIENFEIEPEKIAVVYPGVDEIFANKEGENENKTFTFGMSAPGFEKKGGYIFLKSLKLLKDNGYKFKAKIIYPKYKKNLFVKLLVKFFGLEKEVEFLNFQKDISFFYNSLDCVVMPSKEDSFGMVALEAMIRSKPVIVSLKAGACEIIKDGENGFVFDINKNAEFNLYEKMKYIIENKDGLEEVCLQAVETAKEYNWQRLYKDFMCNLP
jgi:glycosyltransferase involved in cell wall biosynthesis